jgi:hypothetical protein
MDSAVRASVRRRVDALNSTRPDRGWTTLNIRTSEWQQAEEHGLRRNR